MFTIDFAAITLYLFCLKNSVPLLNITYPGLISLFVFTLSLAIPNL